MVKLSWKTTLKRELFSLPALVIITVCGFGYILLSLYLLNFHFVLQIIRKPFPLFTKINILLSLFGGLWTSLSINDILLLLAMGVLVGLNIYLAIRTIVYLENSGKVELSIGGASIIGLITTGCSSCGFSFLSMMGISATISFLPFHGLELRLIAVVLLVVSCIYMLIQLNSAKKCPVHSKRQAVSRSK